MDGNESHPKPPGREVLLRRLPVTYQNRTPDVRTAAFRGIRFLNTPKSLEQIADEIRAHKGCGFEPCEQATNMVPGEGNPNADIMFIGEAPGKQEDLQGRPFVGAAGKLLDELLQSIDLKREDVFIGNVLKGRPPGNRDPKPEEIAHSWPWLKDQVATIQPDLIVLLGRHAMDWFLPDLRISADHGTAKRYRGQVYMPLYHPAAALYNGSLRQTLFDDFAKIPKTLDKVKSLPDEEKVIEPANVATEGVVPTNAGISRQDPDVRRDDKTKKKRNGRSGHPI